MSTRSPADSFDEFFRSAWPSLVGEAFLFVANEALAQDLAQEALSRAWLSWHRISRYDNPGAWTRRVMHNLAISEGRRDRVRRKHMSEERAWTAPPDAVAVDLARALQTLSPDAVAVDLARALQTLSPVHRSALLLHDVVGIPVEEIGKQLKTPAGTIRSWLSRDRILLAQQLRETDPESRNLEAHHE